jgi:hypothetical protein
MFITDSISFPTLLALASRQGGETLAADAN